MNSKKSKKNNAKSPNAENKKKVASKPRKAVEPRSENDEDEELNNSSASDWDPISSDSEDEYTEEDMESYLRAFYKQMWARADDPGPSRPDQFYQYFCKQHFEDTRQYLKNKKKASKGKKKTTKKQVTAKGKKKKISKNEEKVQAALLKLMPKLYKTQLKVMTRRILKAKPINYELLHALSDILKDKHRELKLTGKPKYRDLEPEQLQILHLLEGCGKGYSRTHVARHVAGEYLRKVGYQRDKQKRLERQALKAAGGPKKGK